MNSKNVEALIIFTKNPELGKCKTRLAQKIGDQKALEIYKILLKRTAEIVKDLPVDKYVFYNEKIVANDVWNSSVFFKDLQSKGDLGIKMYKAFENLFLKAYEKVIIIGSDLYDLSPQLISDAFDALKQNEFVIGPAKDGGYYLLGMKKLNKKIFENKVWSTESVLSDTMKDLEGKNTKLLIELNDIDTYEDLISIPELCKHLIDNDKRDN